MAMVTLLAVSLLIFILSRLAGDPRDVYLDDYSTIEDYERLTITLGLDKPYYQQYGIFMKDALSGKFGDSVLVVVALLLILAGIGGAWGGFQFGSTREVACCTGPVIKPITYMALGAIIVANAAALVVHMIEGMGRRRDWPGFRSVVPVPPPVRPAGHE